MTHYEVLGVSETATSEEIKRAYRKLAGQHHPDRGGDTKKFQEIQAAYDVISDSAKRQQYDIERKGGGPNNIHFTWHTNGAGHPDIDAIFRNFGFGGDPFGHFRQQPRRNKDLRIEVPITLDSTLQAQQKDISIQTTNGERQTITVNIPRGVTNGTNIKYPGLGDNLFNTLPRGDLFVHIDIQNDPKFHPIGIDLVTSVSVNCILAIVGGSIMFDGLDGRTFELTIPPGTQPGTKFRIQGQGLYQLDSNNRGNLYVEIELEVPKDLNDQQIESLRSLINPK